MTKYIFKKIPQNWYKYDLLFSIELLTTFVNGIENQVDINIKEYELKKETIIIEEHPKENYARIIDYHNGLDSDTWDLETVFKEYFPTLQRRSAFLSLYGFLEHELNKLCVLYKDSNNYSISFGDLNDRGIDRSIKYLTLIAKLPIDKSTDNWEQIKSIQKTRNLIVHNDGLLVDIHGNPRKSEQKIVSQNEYLKSDNEIIILKGFLSFVLIEFNKLFKSIDELIQKQNLL